jgi:hypothetical protein
MNQRLADSKEAGAAAGEHHPTGKELASPDGAETHGVSGGYLDPMAPKSVSPTTRRCAPLRRLPILVSLGDQIVYEYSEVTGDVWLLDLP